MSLQPCDVQRRQPESVAQRVIDTDVDRARPGVRRQPVAIGGEISFYFPPHLRQHIWRCGGPGDGRQRGVDLGEFRGDGRARRAPRFSRVVAQRRDDAELLGHAIPERVREIDAASGARQPIDGAIEMFRQRRPLALLDRRGRRVVGGGLGRRKDADRASPGAKGCADIGLAELEP